MLEHVPKGSAARSGNGAPGPNADAPHADAEQRAITVDVIAQMSAVEVDELFRNADAGPIPHGDAQGTAIFAPGRALEPLLESIAVWFWQGKVFHGRTKTLKNKILPIGIHAIAADVYPGRSWFDGKDCIVLDYSKRSLLARSIRDEIRRVAPGLYVGLVYVGRVRLAYFTLQFQD